MVVNGESTGKSKWAQCFLLKGKSLVRAVDVFMCPGANGAVLLSVEVDRDDRPGGALAASVAQARFDPRGNLKNLNNKFEGYYTFQFEEALELDAGRYWIVLDVEDPSERCSFQVPVVEGEFPGAIVQLWKPGTGWLIFAHNPEFLTNYFLGETAFFGVHGEADD